MASHCPKCHEIVDEDVVCCAELRYTWKCNSCSKLTQGFVVPYGRCFMCGGDLQVVEGYKADNAEKARAVEEAVQFEVDMYHFYRLALTKTKNAALRAVLEELYQKEEDHLDELEDKYHVHLDKSVREVTPSTEELLSKQLFGGIRFDDDGHVKAVYDKAIAMEKRTYEHFKARAQALPAGVEKNVMLELAAEEQEHVALLESERDQLGAR